MNFLKLDTQVIESFDQALGDQVVSVKTGFWRSIGLYSKHRGLGRALILALRACLLPGETSKDLIHGNVQRKKIRLPKAVANPVILAVYGYFKRIQAAALEQALRAEIQVNDPLVSVIFNGSVYPESVLAAVTSDRRRVFVEGGFFPKTLQVDPKGLNAANSVPRDVSFYLETEEDFSVPDFPKLVNNRPSKGRFAPVDLPKSYVFVPFQVPSDMQVTLHSAWVRNMEQFLDVVCEAADRNENEIFVIKEHPSFKRSVMGRRSHPRVIFANGNVTSDLIRGARVVITLNSTVGIEALLLERPVITLGEACYNLPGLVRHTPNARDLDLALRDTNWEIDGRLRRQYLGYLWNRYLVHGTFAAPPRDLADQLNQRS